MAFAFQPREIDIEFHLKLGLIYPGFIWSSRDFYGMLAFVKVTSHS